MINSGRLSNNRRLYSVFASANLSIFLGTDAMVSVLDATNIFLESVEDDDTTMKVYGCLSKIFVSLGSKHPVFFNLVSRMKGEIRSKSKSARKRALSVFRILCLYLPKDDCVSFAFLFLADTEIEVRTFTKNDMGYIKRQPVSD